MMNFIVSILIKNDNTERLRAFEYHTQARAYVERRAREQDTVRDWVEAPAVKENITLRKGLAGVKPQKLSFWLFEIWNMKPGDEFVDIFPGSGEVTRAWQIYRQRLSASPEQLELAG